MKQLLQRWCGGVGRAALLLLALAPSSVGSATTRAPHGKLGPSMSGSCLGLWGGVGRNSGSPPWTILMNVTALEGASCGTIEYPSLGCGGFLTQCSRRGGEVRFEEQYTHGFDRCAPQGVVRARCQGAVLDWTWEGQEVVHTTLRRR